MRNLSRLESVDQAGVCGDTQACLLERLQAGAYGAQLLLSKVLIKQVLVVNTQAFHLESVSSMRLW